MSALMQDLKYAFRLLVKSPGFTAAAVIVLALGIGANTAIFSVVNAVLLRPLPFQRPEKLVQVWHVPPAKSFPGIPIFAVSPANFLDWQRQSSSFEQMAIYGFSQMNLSGSGEPEAITSAKVSASFFSVLRAEPLLGRTFAAEDEQPGRGRVVVISQSFWQSHFNANANIVGQQITLNDQNYNVIGVLSSQLQFPMGVDAPPKIEMWTPLQWDDKERAVRGNHNYEVIARLKPGATVEQAQAEMNTISAQLEQQYPQDDKGWGAKVVPLREELVGNVRPALMMLLGAVAFVLLIACANVANLVLARTLARKKEIAIRSALGASRAQLMRQVLTESVLLALAGGVLGLLIAHFGMKLIVNFLAGEMPRSGDIGLDAGVLAFTFGISILTGLIAGFTPAWRLTKADVSEALKQGSRGASDGAGNKTRSALVICEVALSLMLLVGAGLTIRTLWLLHKADPGFDPHHVETMTLAIPATKYATPVQKMGFFDQVLARVPHLPDVQSAGLIDSLPMSGGGSTQPIAIEGHPVVQMSEQPEVAVRRITPGFLSTMRMPLLQGRDLSDADREGKPWVVLISESMAKRFWPNENPIGRHLSLTFFGDTPREVVGVVGDVKQDGLDASTPSETIYYPLAQQPGPEMSLAVRTSGEPSAIASEVTKAIREIDPEQPVLDVISMDKILSTSLAQRRFTMLLLAAFAGLALLLAAVGIYSVLSYAVKRRTREIGIRMALGAQIEDVLRLIVTEGMKPTLIGLAIGIAGALALGRFLASLVYGVSATDVITFASVSLLLLSVGLMASIVPAYRATKVEPVKTLREE